MHLLIDRIEACAASKPSGKSQSLGQSRGASSNAKLLGIHLSVEARSLCCHWALHNPQSLVRLGRLRFKIIECCVIPCLGRPTRSVWPLRRDDFWPIPRIFNDKSERRDLVTQSIGFSKVSRLARHLPRLNQRQDCLRDCNLPGSPRSNV